MSHLSVALSAGEGGQVEDAGWPDGRTNHQWRACDAPTPWLHPGLWSGPVEGDLCLWQCFHPEGDPLCPAPGKDGRSEGLWPHSSALEQERIQSINEQTLINTSKK